MASKSWIKIRAQISRSISGDRNKNWIDSWAEFWVAVLGPNEISWVPSLALLGDPVPVPAVGLGAACREMVPYMGFPCAFLSTPLSEPPRDPDSFATHSLRTPQAEVTEAGPHKVRPNFFARLPYEFLAMLLRKGARYPQGPNRFLFGAPIDS